MLTAKLSKPAVASLGAALLALPALAMTVFGDGKDATYKASDLIGRGVENTAGENLGKIEDLAIDGSQGSVSYAVLSFGGFLGMGDKLFAIPFNALRHGEDKCVLDVSKERLEQAPGFDKASWPDLSDRTWGARVYEFYGVTPYWMAGEKTTDLRAISMIKAEPGDAKSFDGTVTRVEGHSVTIKTDDGDLCVHLAPTSFLAAQNCPLRVDDEIKVKAVEVPSPTGFDKVLVGTELQKGNRVVVLRNGDGTPAWSANHSGG